MQVSKSTYRLDLFGFARWVATTVIPGDFGRTLAIDLDRVLVQFSNAGRSMKGNSAQGEHGASHHGTRQGVCEA